MQIVTCLLLASPFLPGSGARPGSIDEQGETLILEEHFVIEQLDGAQTLDPWQILGAPLTSRGAEHADATAHAVGLILWRRSAGPSGRSCEWDVRFPERETRLLHVERDEALGRTLVFREMQPQSGRTLSADWIDAGATLRLREWSGPEGIVERLEDCAGGLFMLELLERLRAESAGVEQARVFDPLSRRFEELTVSTQIAPQEGRWAGTRRIELTRADGSLAGAYLLRGTEVLGFQWQAGTLRMRRIEPEEHARRLKLLLSGPETAPTAE